MFDNGDKVKIVSGTQYVGRKGEVMEAFDKQVSPTKKVPYLTLHINYLGRIEIQAKHCRLINSYEVLKVNGNEARVINKFSTRIEAEAFINQQPDKKMMAILERI